MEDNKYTKFISKYRNELKNTALSDEEMMKATGGVGGANEATCPKCGKPMPRVDNPYGDGYWHCGACNINQICSDAEYIELVRILEQQGVSGIEYPVWWPQVNH